MKSYDCRYRSFFFMTSLFSVLAAVVFIAGGAAVCQASNLTIDLGNGTLSADIKQVPIQKVLTELSQKGNITVFLDTSLNSNKITAHFKNLPIEDGIKKLVSPYSSTMVFNKRSTADGQDELYVSEVKVFESSNKNTAFEQVGKKRFPTASTEGNMPRKNAITVAAAPLEVRDPAAAAAMRKRVSASILRTRMAQKNAAIRRQQQKMRHEELQSIRRIQHLEEQLQLVSEKGRTKMQAQLSMLKTNLRNTRQRNQSKLRTLQRENNQLKHQQLKYGAALSENHTKLTIEN